MNVDREIKQIDKAISELIYPKIALQKLIITTTVDEMQISLGILKKIMVLVSPLELHLIRLFVLI